MAQLFAVSTLRLLPLDAGATLKNALAAPMLIATSPAAVRHAAAQRMLKQKLGQRWYALGGGTAAALRRHGIAQVTQPERGAHSEGLLARSELQDVRGLSIGLLTAPGGRELIADHLRRRGAVVVRADVYQRRPRVPPPQRLAALMALPRRSALLVSSAEALAVLWSALDAVGRQELCARLAIASSERLCAVLQRLGFSRIVRAESARPAALLAALSMHVDAERLR